MDDLLFLLLSLEMMLILHRLAGAHTGPLVSRTAPQPWSAWEGSVPSQDQHTWLGFFCEGG